MATKKASQDTVPIKEIREGVVILKNRAMRTIIMTSSLNFALKSNEEQTAIVLQYQNFLNSLDFTIQFYVQSRNLNIKPYLETLKEREKRQTNELLRVQTREYMDFIEEFVSATKIVSKTFYVVVPYSPTLFETKTSPAIDFMNKLFKPEATAAKKPAVQGRFEEHKVQLQQRTATVLQGLSRFGVRGVPLNTEELIELFYGLYNPGDLGQSQIPEHGEREDSLTTYQTDI